MCDITGLGERVLLAEERSRLKVDDYLPFIRSLPSTVRTVEVVGGGEPLLLKDISVLFEAIKTKSDRSLLRLPLEVRELIRPLLSSF